jgi:predicted alpha/beta hydrolase
VPARAQRWLFSGAVLMVAGLGLAWLLGTTMVRPAASVVQPAHPPARDLRMATADGVSLAATYWPGRSKRSPAILLLHGNGASRAAMAANAAWFAHQGYAALTIDFRGHGQSTMRTRSFGLDESRDAAAALAWLKREQGGARVAVIGVSLGGAASLIGRDGPIAADAFILQAVYPDMRSAIRNRIASSLLQHQRSCWNRC